MTEYATQQEQILKLERHLTELERDSGRLRTERHLLWTAIAFLAVVLAVVVSRQWRAESVIETQEVRVLSKQGSETIVLSADGYGSPRLEMAGRNGKISLTLSPVPRFDMQSSKEEGMVRVWIPDNESAQLRVGGLEGHVSIEAQRKSSQVTASGENGQATMGGYQGDARIDLRHGKGETLRLTADRAGGKVVAYSGGAFPAEGERYANKAHYAELSKEGLRIRDSEKAIEFSARRMLRETEVGCYWNHYEELYQKPVVIRDSCWPRR